ncbi:Uncharacterised protein [Vibrio cholerae]|nr:Uncharacterised protein [Vibrio cholerae]
MSVYKYIEKNVLSVANGIENGAFVKEKNSKLLDCSVVESVGNDLILNEVMTNNSFSVLNKDIDVVGLNPNVQAKSNAVMVVEGSVIEAIGYLMLDLDPLNDYYIDLLKLTEECGFVVENAIVFDSITFSTPKKLNDEQLKQGLKFSDVYKNNYSKKLNNFINEYFSDYTENTRDNILDSLVSKIEGIKSYQLNLIEYNNKADIKRIHRNNQRLR